MGAGIINNAQAGAMNLMGRIQEIAANRIQMQQAADTFSFNLESLNMQKEMHGLKVEEQRRLKQVEIRNQVSITDLAKTMAEIPPGTEGFKRKMLLIASQNPLVMETQQWKWLSDSNDKALDYLNAARKIEIEETRQKAVGKIIDTTVDGKKVSFIQQPDGNLKQLSEGAQATTRTLADGRVVQGFLQPSGSFTPFPEPAVPEFQKRIGAVDEAQTAFDNAQSNFIANPTPENQKLVAESERKLIETQAVTKGSTTGVGEIGSSGQGVPSAGAGGGAVSIGTGLQSQGVNTMVARKMPVFETSMDLINDIENSLSGWTVGPWGSNARKLGNVVGVVFPGLTHSEANEVMAKVATLDEKILHEIPEGSGSGRVTIAGRQSMRDLLPSTKAWSNPQQSLDNIKVLKEYVRTQARNYGAQVGIVPLVSMTQEEIFKDSQARSDELKEMARTGRINKDQYTEALKENKKVHLDAIQRWHFKPIK